MEEKDAFYVARKGDTIGVYKNLSDFQDQAVSSVCHPSLSVHKGYCLPKEAEEHLISHGLNNATYCINANDMKDGLFGKLVDFPLQQPFEDKASEDDPTEKRMLEFLQSGNYELKIGQMKPFKSEKSCLLEFDGATKQNPGQCGAGAVLYADDGSLFWRLREGIGFGTNHIAEYRAVILGLRYALKRGLEHICVQGDSELVCMQIEGIWKCKNQDMARLFMEARGLKDKFVSFEITHVPKMYNIDADAQAKLALDLKDGEIQVECDVKYIKCLEVM